MQGLIYSKKIIMFSTLFLTKSRLGRNIFDIRLFFSHKIINSQIHILCSLINIFGKLLGS